MAPTFRADQIGSLIRPQYLLDAQLAVTDWGRMHTKIHDDASQDLIDKVHDAEHKAIKDVVAEQVKRGVLPISSGEFERASFVSGFFERVEGIEIRQMNFEQTYRTGFPIVRPYARRGIPSRDTPIAVGKIRWKGSTYMNDWLYVRSLLPQERWKDVKFTIPAPNWAHTQLKDGLAYTKEAYTDEYEYLKDVGEAVRQEVLALYDAGMCVVISIDSIPPLIMSSRFVQIDDPMIAMLCDQPYLEAQKVEGKDLDALLDPAIFAHNVVARDMPSDLTLAVHLCLGNGPKSDAAGVGGFDDMAPNIFSKMEYKRFALEFDDLANSFAPLQHLPTDKVIVLGLVTTKSAEMETLEGLRSRIHEAADIIAKAQGKTRQDVIRDNIAVSPSCGFASLSVLHGVPSAKVQWQKLELLKQVAEQVLGGS